MASRSRILFSVALSLALATAATTVVAAPTPADRESARRLMDEGKENVKAGDLPRALAAYSKAHEIMRVPTTGMGLVRIHLALNHLVEARDVALEVMRMPREPGESPVFEKARQSAKEVEAQLKPRIPTVRIQVRGGPATRVTVDGIEIAITLLGAPVAVNPGKRVIVARNADDVEKRIEMDVAERESREIDIELPPVRAKTIVPTPPRRGDARPSDPPERGERSGAATILLYGGFGLGVAGLATGVVAGALTLTAADDVLRRCENSVCEPAAAADLNSAETMATVSTVGFVVAGVGGALGVVGLLLPRAHARGAETQGATSLWLGPTSVGVRGTF